MKPWRLPEDPRLQALRGTVIEGERVVVWAVSAGEWLDELAHRQIWRTRSTTEQCALYGSKRGSE